MIPLWNIISEGPSAAYVTKADLLDGPVVAINMAIRKAEEFRVHVWAVEDDPRVIWKHAKPYHPELMMVWGAVNHAQTWLRKYPASKLYLTEPSLLMDPVDNVAPVLSTIFPTLVKAQAHGARCIRVFGADMRGSGSPFTKWRPGLLGAWTEEESEQYAARWRVERRMFAHAIRRAKEEGVRIERWKHESCCSDHQPIPM